MNEDELVRGLRKLADQASPRPGGEEAVVARSRGRRRLTAIAGAVAALLIVGGVAGSSMLGRPGQETGPRPADPTFARFIFEASSSGMSASGVLEVDGGNDTICLLGIYSDNIKAAHLIDVVDRGRVLVTFFEPSEGSAELPQRSPVCFREEQLQEGPLLQHVIDRPAWYAVDFHRGPNDHPGLVANLQAPPEPGRRGITAEHVFAFAVQARPDSDSDDMDIYVSREEGEDARPFLHSDAAEFYPAWSPKGDRLAFVSDIEEPANIDIYVVDADGSNLERLTDHPAIDTAPAWSPDGTRITFARNLQGQDDIFVVMADASSELQLTDNSFIDGPSTWSPDSSRIAFVRNQNGQVDIWTMDPAGANEERLTDDAAAEGSLAWAPSGSALAFTVRPSDSADTEIALLDLSDDSVRRLTEDEIDQDFVTWSPDGRHLLFSSGSLAARDQEPSAMHVLNLDAGTTHRIPAIPGRGVLMPSWRG